jgi:hypothetical protein
MKDLNEYVKSNSRFLSISDGETVTMIYKGYTIVDDRFNLGKKTVQYLLQDPETDKVIPWVKSSNKVALQMLKMPLDELISITRIGEGPKDTNYKIRLYKTQPKATDEKLPF